LPTPRYTKAFIVDRALTGEMVLTGDKASIGGKVFVADIAFASGRVSRRQAIPEENFGGGRAAGRRLGQ
jgi:UDP-3-O-[3-hydroxymyristoyl] glucosamine N-acyltransferase